MSCGITIDANDGDTEDNHVLRIRYKFDFYASKTGTVAAAPFSRR